MPRLWTETVAQHRLQVRDAILDTTADLVTARGLLSVTMSEIAERTGIGRATLYKYFSDVEAILLAWHERQITEHLNRLEEARNTAAGPEERLRAVLEAYALIDHEHHGSAAHHRHFQDAGLAALLHRGGHVARAQRELRDMVQALITESATVGDVRDDVPAVELAVYCLHALQAANTLHSKAAVRRLVDVTLEGLRPPRRAAERG